MYNLQTVSEVPVVIVGNLDHTFSEWDILVNSKLGTYNV